GWYTEILAPVLREHGHLIEAGGRSSGPFADMLKANKTNFGNIQVIPFSPPDQVKLGADDSADMVLTFRNTHDWLNKDDAALESAFKAAYAVLKPGGILGVVEHRAKPFADAEISSKGLHRIPEDYMIALALKTGFRLEGVSEVNANPDDPEDINVHRLPPDLVGPKSDHAKMKAIGESDRMTLQFIKP
ncbi:MAG: class I SAM-dependent methyltransferase, partial [Gammaproteobacteria bacterium]